MAAPAASSSQLEDMITVIPAPSTAFEHRRDGKFGIAMLVATAITVLIGFLSRVPMAAVLESDMTRSMKAAMAKNPQLTAAMAEKMSRATSGFAWMFSLGTPILICIVGLMLWLAGKLVGSKQTAGQAIAVSTFAFVPRIISAIVSWAQMLFLSPESLNGMSRLSVGPARFLDPDVASPINLALALRFDLFLLWSTVLLGIGLSVTGRVTRKQGMVGAGIVWLLATLMAVGGAIKNSP